MKILVFAVISLLALACGVFVPPRPGHKKHLLGEKECTFGPSYWCQNLTNAGDCHATKHCIQTVWIHKQYPEDTSNICDTCKEMVKQARDQLESNETQELIKEVFEGSCALLRLKPVVKECDKIADDYIPDLIDTLASEMNPQTVCAVAGLCNNPRIDQLLVEDIVPLSNKPTSIAPRNRCDDCNTVMDIIVNKFNNMKRDDFLESLLQACGEMSSFSDACSNIIITNFPDIYSYLKQNVNAGDLCLLSGECYANFHKHEVEITPMSKIGYVPVIGEKDDLPCELCEQLVNHLREVLVANTTEAEFKLVLQNICKQTKQSFRKECVDIVDQYYDKIYNYLVNALNASATCELIKICPNNAKNMGIIAPLLPVETAEAAYKLNRDPQHVYIPTDDIVVKVMKPKQESPILSAQQMQLPIDLLVPPHQQLYNQQFCVFCQYFLHYVQKAITDPKVEDDVKKVVDEACSKLPKSVNETCIEFVNTYEPALVAILAQEIDPSEICPLIKVCPSEEVKDVEIFLRAKSSSKCPLCLYAVTELESMMKGKKTEDEVKQCLEKLCNQLPGSLKPECTDFVNTYTNELVELLVADLNPQEVCVYLKLCTDETPVSENQLTGDIETNAIHDDTVESHLSDETCVLCEFIMKEIDDQLKDKKTDDDIKNIVHKICSELPGTVKDSCNKFVSQYADAIIILLQETLDPKSMCSYLKLCSKQQHPLEFVKEEITKCGVCTAAADIMQTILKNPKIDHSVEHIFEKTCRGMPSEMKKTCISTFCKDGELNYTNVAMVMDLVNVTDIIQYQYLKNVGFFECPACRLVVKSIQAACKGNMTRAVIESVLKTVCLPIPRLFRHTCDQMLDKYFNELADLIIKYGDDGIVCQMIMLCGTRHLNFNAMEGIITDTSTSIGMKKCETCQYAIFIIEYLLYGQPLTVIHDQLIKMCSLMRNPMRNICRQEIATHWPQFLKWIGHLSERQICHFAGMCSASPPVSRKYKLSMTKKCELCQFAFIMIKSLLQENKALKMIHDRLISTCNLMPVPLKNVCNNEVNTHWRQWVRMLLNVNEGQICHSFRMCSAPPYYPIKYNPGQDSY